ncbi:uncharacterized protein LOC116287150 [Actinia tenebrosa]|uniref:Uncharacterized protein LOC116287150 n=1 Tax=Actinia tenebrosa TaxID=6105 RepID=A0A6P8HAX9_ACTTE|nr:uncharacterized protein LOC116287150 [Actinia tenebrosa]
MQFIVLVVVVFAYGVVQVVDAQQVLTVQVAYFSGRPDPKWKVTPTSPNYANIIKAYNNAKNTKMTFPLTNMPNKFGYRGLVIREGANKQDLKLVVGLKTKQLQKLLLQSAPKGNLNPTLLKKIASAIEQGVQPANIGRKKRYTLEFPAEGSESNWIKPLFMRENNCYNYANDVLNIGETLPAEPGVGGGQIYAKITPAEIKAAAIRDGLVEKPAGPGDAIPNIEEAEGHLVALFVAEGDDSDYHWLRRDGNLKWSHKQGHILSMRPPTNKDANGAEIKDPRTAAMIYGENSPQYKFVCFMSSNKDTVKIIGLPRPEDD